MFIASPPNIYMLEIPKWVLPKNTHKLTLPKSLNKKVYH